MLGPPRRPTEDRAPWTTSTCSSRASARRDHDRARGRVLVLIVIVSWRLARASRGWSAGSRALTRGGDGPSLESTLEAHIDKVFDVVRELRRARGPDGGPGADAAPSAFQRVGLVRFNPFEDTGGNQSFALALLDQHGDGFVVSAASTPAPAPASTARRSRAGKSEAALSDEEAEALAPRARLRDGTGEGRLIADATRDTRAGTGSAHPRVMPRSRPRHAAVRTPPRGPSRSAA